LLRLVDASKVTISLTIVAALLASAIAFISGVLLLNRHKIIRFLVRTYVEIFRGTSLLVQLSNKGNKKQRGRFFLSEKNQTKGTVPFV